MKTMSLDTSLNCITSSITKERVDTFKNKFQRKKFKVVYLVPGKTV